MTLIGWSTAVLGLVAFYLLFHFFGPEGDKPTAVAFEDSVPLIDDILAEWKPQLFDAPYEGYRGHCYRVWHFVKALYPGSLTAVQREQLAIALAHHDLGIWSDRLSDGRRNVDYIQPSVDRAVAWLKQHKKPAEWIEPVSLMISEHHKVRRYHDGPNEVAQLVEAVRQADLIDFSLGLSRQGLSRALISSVRTRWPNAGFHWGLLTLNIERLRTDPLHMWPMFKWLAAAGETSSPSANRPVHLISPFTPPTARWLRLGAHSSTLAAAASAPASAHPCHCISSNGSELAIGASTALAMIARPQARANLSIVTAIRKHLDRYRLTLRWRLHFWIFDFALLDL